MTAAEAPAGAANVRHRMGNLQNLQVRLPRSVKSALKARARLQGITLRAAYTALLSRFVKAHRTRRPGGERLLFLATRRGTQGVVLQLWLSTALYRAVSQIASREGISKRAVVYTALMLGYLNTMK